MRNSRTEDIVRELYLAVNEREYYIFKAQFYNYSNEGGSLPALDSEGRVRVQQAMKYIQETLTKWLEPESNHINVLSQGVRVPLGSMSCFVDEVYIPPTTSPHKDTRNDFLYGFKNLDYTVSGNLETQYNIDLSLLRNPPQRVDLSWCKMVFDLLQLNLKVNIDLWNATYFTGFGFLYRVDPGYLFNDINQDVENCFYISEKNNGSGDVFNDIVNEINSNANLSMLADAGTKPLSELQYSGADNTELVIGSTRTYKSYKIQGFNQLFNITDLSYSSFSLGYYINDPLSIMPYSNVSFGAFIGLVKSEYLTQQRIDSASTSQPIKEGEYLVFDDVLTSFDYLDPLDNNGGTSEQLVLSCIFIDINKEGLLNYYTEPTP